MEFAMCQKDADSSSAACPAPKSGDEFQDFLQAFLLEVSKFEEDCARRTMKEERDWAVVLRPPRLNLSREWEGGSPMGRRDDSRPRFSRARIAKAVSTVASQTVSA